MSGSEMKTVTLTVSLCLASFLVGYFVAPRPNATTHHPTTSSATWTSGNTKTAAIELKNASDIAVSLRQALADVKETAHALSRRPEKFDCPKTECARTECPAPEPCPKCEKERVHGGHKDNPCNVASPWIGDPPSAWNGRNFEGITLPKSIYDPNKPWGPTKYRAPRAVHPLLYHLGADMDRYNYFEQFSHVKDAVVVEIGAWDGENTLTIGSMPNVKTVYTFEATPNKMDGIRQKMAPVANKVKLINAAVTNYTGSATLYVPPTAQGMQDSIGPQKYHLGDVNTIQVPAVRLDDVVKEHVDYIVTDTQGNEFHVLLGAEKLIDEYGVDAIRFEWIPKMAANNNENLGDMLHYLHDKGYMCMDSKSAPIPFGPGVDRSYSNYPYLYATNNGANYQGSWTDLLCIKVR